VTHKRPCIVCGRSIRKRVEVVYVIPSTCAGGSGGYDAEARLADLRSKEDCLRHTNLPHVIFINRWGGEFVRVFHAWDGESFESKYFCTNNCAMMQGHASAQHGNRYTWAKP
jgi:hypothetical protein